MKMMSMTDWNILILIPFIFNLLFINGQYIEDGKCDDILVNTHMLQCYKDNIDPSIDTASNENAYFMDGIVLCHAYNQSSSYRKCLYSIFDRNAVCSLEEYPYSYQYYKIYWKLILSSCLLDNNDHCSPSLLSEHILNKCHYSFDDQYPIKCKEFLRSLKCLERYEMRLIPSRSQSKCSRNKAYYYFYEDLAARLQLSIPICELDLTS